MRSIRRVRRISAEDKELLAELKRIVLGFVPDATLILYGSAARGERDPESDYDVLILLNSPLSKELDEELDTAIYALELDREAVLSTFLVTQKQWNQPRVVGSPYRRNVEREAVLL
jgi:predicted nucleotidyltransferase